MLKPIVFRLIAVGVATCATLFATEIVLRFSAASQYVYRDPVLLSGPITYLPNQTARHQLAREFNVIIHINSQGFRDDDFTPTQDARTAVALGDSFTEGFGVEAGDVWEKRLQARLRADKPGFQHVYNAGHSGTNPKNYVAVYDQFFKADPSVELVIVGFCLANDIVEESTPSVLRSQRNRKTSFGQMFANHSIIYNLARSRLRYDRRLEGIMAGLGFTNPPVFSIDLLNVETNRRRWPYTAEFLKRFGQQVHADGKKFLVVLMPSKELVLDDYFNTLLAITKTPVTAVDRFGFRDYLLEQLEGSGIATLDLTPTFQERPGYRAADVYFVGDSHWNPSGHQRAADAIHQYLTKKGMV